jgi:hypothetical protein
MTRRLFESAPVIPRASDSPETQAGLTTLGKATVIRRSFTRRRKPGLPGGSSRLPERPGMSAAGSRRPLRSPRLLYALVVCAVTLLARPAAAQGDPAWLRARAVEADIAVAWLGGESLGRAPATLIPNQSQGGTYELFTTDTTLASAPAFEARVGYRVTRSLAVEAAFLVGSPELRTRITRDTEDAAEVTATERLSEYRVDGSVVWHLTRLGGSRAVPFVFGGAGYIRQLHQDRVLLETGHTFHAGAGVKVALSTRQRGLIRSLGLRADARVYVRDGGLAVDGDKNTHTSPAASAGLMVGF